MKITAIETIRLVERPNLLWVQVETDEGLTGLGETFFIAATVETYVHEYIAPRVIGRDPLQIDLLAADLNGYLGFRSTGAEVRGNSAFDIALWDLFGKVTGQPIAQLLGGFSPPGDPHLQHLRRCRIHQEGHRAELGQLRAGRLRAIRRSQRLPQQCRRACRLAARGRHHRDEDLALRPGRRKDPRASTSRPPT